MTINISEAKGPSETRILRSKMCQFFILSTHLSTWTLKQATFLFVAVSSFENCLRPLKKAGIVNVAPTDASGSCLPLLHRSVAGGLEAQSL